MWLLLPLAFVSQANHKSYVHRLDHYVSCFLWISRFGLFPPLVCVSQTSPPTGLCLTDQPPGSVSHGPASKLRLPVTRLVIIGHTKFIFIGIQ